ncbi:MAG: hypothetical protein ACI4RD_04715, partial [Kiritimatiellia bacterium]
MKGLRVLAIGAHPDDPDLDMGATARLPLLACGKLHPRRSPSRRRSLARATVAALLVAPALLAPRSGESAAGRSGDAPVAAAIGRMPKAHPRI